MKKGEEEEEKEIKKKRREMSPLLIWLLDSHCSKEKGLKKLFPQFRFHT